MILSENAITKPMQVVDAIVILVQKPLEYPYNKYMVYQLRSSLVTSMLARYKLFSAKLTKSPCLTESRHDRHVLTSRKGIVHATKCTPTIVQTHELLPPNMGSSVPSSMETPSSLSADMTETTEQTTEYLFEC